MIKKLSQPTRYTYDKYQNHLCHSINRYISYVKNNAISDYEIHLINPQQTDDKECFNHVTMVGLLPIAISIKENIFSLPLNILGFCYPNNLIRKDYISPSELVEVLCHFRKFCFNKSPEPVFICNLPITDWNLISNEEINERTRTEYIYDFSMKRIKTIQGIIDGIEMEDETGNLEDGEIEKGEEDGM